MSMVLVHTLSTPTTTPSIAPCPQTPPQNSRRSLITTPSPWRLHLRVRLGLNLVLGQRSHLLRLQTMVVTGVTKVAPVVDLFQPTHLSHLPGLRHLHHHRRRPRRLHHLLFPRSRLHTTQRSTLAMMETMNLRKRKQKADPKSR